MKLSLRTVRIQPATEGEDSPSIGAELTILFPNAGDNVLIAGSIGVTFSHPAPETLTFAEIEPLAVAEVLAALG
ncbi:hypothetical protein WMR10_001015 [Stenotrophomonas maltophilia]|uniref:hypothetical protein n=1 Tax=Stenotrophomonas maltophilia TaxID=40324 RepID=UPI0030BF37D5